jgi:aryl-alcohol dehydrogenase (NADP+)
MTFGSKEWREWTLSEEQGRPIFKRALDLGINFFDTADMYSLGASEEITGRVLNDLVRRQEVVIATKVFHPMSDHPNDRGLSRLHIMRSIDHSLQRLGTDYVDLYQIHRWDYDTPIEETMGALNDVVKSGKARYIGASSMYAWQFALAQFTAEKHGWTRFISMQNYYNLIYREEEREMNPLCDLLGVGLIPWSPLARGSLTGKKKFNQDGDTLRAKTDRYARQLYDKTRDNDQVVIDRLVELAAEVGYAPIQVGLAWLLHKPGVVSPIIGVSKLKQLDELAEALAISLSPGQLEFLEELYQPHPILGHN